MYGVAALAVASALAACGDSPPPNAIVTMPDASGTNGTDSGSGYVIKSLSGGGGGGGAMPLGCGSAGTQSVVAVSGSTVAFASLAPTTMVQTCMLDILGVPSMSQADVWNVCYASSDPGGTYTSQVVTSQPYLGPTGVGLAFDASGTPTVAFTGVGSTPPMETCGSNDVFVTSLQGGKFSTPVQVSTGSQVGGYVGSQYQMGMGCPQGVCNMGDAAGFWPAVAFDSSGHSFIPYRDEHFGFAADDFSKSSVDLGEGSGGSYQLLQIDVGRGGGTYNRVALNPAGLPAVLQYNEKGKPPGVYIDLQVMAGSFAAQQADGAWASQQLSNGPIGEQLGFAISSKGLYAAAYYDMNSTRLLYTESQGGSTWSTPVSVDINGTTGLYPSLAFDADGNPAIAYYRCSSQVPMPGQSLPSCDPTDDGLYLARRTGTKWTPAVVQSEPNISDGLYPALAFVNGKAVIAFQQSSLDAISQTTTVSWLVAEEP